MTTTVQDLLDFHATEPTASIERAAAFFSLHPDSIKRIFREANDPERPNPWQKRTAPGSDRFVTPEKLARMQTLAADGMPATWIAEDVGVSPESVRKHLGRRPDVLDGWRPVWQAIRRSDELAALHREFAPSGSTVGLSRKLSA